MADQTMQLKTGDAIELHAEEIRRGNSTAALMQTRSPYSTAVQVLKPRNLDAVKAACLREAMYAGDSFYYSWNQGGGVIEGPSIGLAMTIARNYGNCATDVSVEDGGGDWIFRASFIDLETGFNDTRVFRQTKTPPKNKGGKETYSGERGLDVVFQVGQSKAKRNVIIGAVPGWLVDEIMDEAKKNYIKKFESLGPVAMRDVIRKKCESLKVDLARVEKVHGLIDSWTVGESTRVAAELKSIQDGYTAYDDAFPPIEQPAQTQPTATSAKVTGESKPPEQAPQEAPNPLFTKPAEEEKKTKK